jgi:hypothetical protein
MSKPAKTASKPPLTREQAMDIRARADFAKMDKVNQDRSIEYRGHERARPGVRTAAFGTERLVGRGQSLRHDVLAGRRVALWRQQLHEGTPEILNR